MARRLQDIYASMARRLAANSAVKANNYPSYHPRNVFVKPANINELLANPKAGSNEEKVAKYLAESGKTFDELWESAINHVTYTDVTAGYDVVGGGESEWYYSMSIIEEPAERAAIRLGDPNHHFENNAKIRATEMLMNRWDTLYETQQKVKEIQTNVTTNDSKTMDKMFGNWDDYISGGIKNMQKQFLKATTKRG